ncbi:MAG: hypothetical protein CL946_05760 [Ectothiorhodospiraceae bacterium]|nr:hypothetical protein [Ectothiorhodospiraceae bacterium]
MKQLSVLLFAILAFMQIANAQNLTSVDFSARDIDGEDRSFQEFLQQVRGSEDSPKKGVVIISFWALWCKPCKEEMKAIQPIFEQHADKNIHFLAINTDKPRSIAKVKAYVKSQGYPYEFWLDPNSEVFNKLNGQSMPYSLILNEKGELLKKSVGFIAGDEEHVEEVMMGYLE